MANIINNLKKIRPVYRRSSNALKLFVTVIIVFSIVGLFVLRQGIAGMEARNAELENQVQQLQQENEALQENIGNLDTVQGVEQIARDELGLVDPDTVLIQPGD